MGRQQCIGAAVMVLAVAGTIAQGATCAKRDAIVNRLASKYAERLSARGLQSSDALLEVFTSEATGSYTMLLTDPKGNSCIVGSGTAWHEPEAVVEPAGTAS